METMALDAQRGMLLIQERKLGAQIRQISRRYRHTAWGPIGRPLYVLKPFGCSRCQSQAVCRISWMSM